MAKPKLALIPSGVGTDTLYSVLPADGTGDFDFDRSGEATRINKDGLIETVSSNVPRLNYPLIDGVVSGCPSLLLEPESRNLVTYSEDFSNSAWSKFNSSVTNNVVISPDGTQNADEFFDNTSSTAHRLFTTISVVSGSDYTASVFAKYNTLKYLQLTFNGSDFGTSQYATFDLLNGNVSGSSSGTASIKNYGNGWYRCSFKSQCSTTNPTSSFFLITSNSPTVRDLSYVGNGSSAYIWGAMLEQGSYPTSYIPNYGTALGVTRSAETCNNAGDVNTFNDSEGVLMAEFKGLSSSDTSNRRLGITKNGTYEGLRLQMDNGTIGATLYDGTTNQYTKVVNIDNSIFNKVAFKYKANDFALWINGIEYHPQSSGITFVDGTLDDLSFDYVGGNDFYGNTKQVQYYDSALTDSELEKLTSWVSFSDMANGQLYTIE